MQFSERIMLSIVDKYKLSTMRRNGKINKKLWNGRPQRCPLMNFHLSFTESNRKITMQSLTWKHFNRFQLTTMTLFALWFDYGEIIGSIFNSVSNFFIKIFFFILRLVFFSLKKTSVICVKSRTKHKSPKISTFLYVIQRKAYKIKQIMCLCKLFNQYFEWNFYFSLI